MKKLILLLAIPFILFSCKKSDDDLALKAVGSYAYVVDHFAVEQDAIIDYGDGGGWPVSPDATGKGTLKVEATDNNRKLKIILDNGLSFITSRLESDALINPTGSFSFSIPSQTTGNATITGINIGRSPDGDLWQGNFALSTDMVDGRNNYELSFGIKYANSDKMVMRFVALSTPVDIDNLIAR